ncbi:Hpt domain-containing protein, partial [Vibrio parahaemolyticus]
LGTFIETTEPVLDDLDAAIAAENWPEVRRHAHAAAGAARMAGAVAMAALCSDVELLAAGGDPAAGSLAVGIRPAFAAAGVAIAGLTPQA